MSVEAPSTRMEWTFSHGCNTTQPNTILYANRGRWLLNPKYSDLKIKCGDRTYSAHRLVVCSNSAYFTTICDGGFKV